jgi:hypothetical protein
VAASRKRSMIAMAICGALLTACVAAPNRIVDAAVSDGDPVAFPNQTGELHLFLMPPDALMGGIAEARR